MELTKLLLIGGMTLALLGKVLVIIAALQIHTKILKEKKIDGVVLREYRIERRVVILGLFCIVCGYILEVIGLDILPL